MSVADAHERPFDPGLQAERTLLAWQRTTLAVGVAGAVGLRLTAPHFGVIAVLSGITCLGLALAGYLGVRYRYRHIHAALHESATVGAVKSWPLAALACSTLALGLLAALFLVGGILG